MSRRLALVLIASLAFLGGCKRAEPEPGRALLFPTLGDRQEKLDTLQLRGAGNRALVTLARKGGQWRVAERGDWPADAGRVSQYLFVLSQTRRVEAKTGNPKLYSRLGVEPIAGLDATGSELKFSGAGKSSRLLIGHEHLKFDSNYVRVDGHVQAWLTDLPVSFNRDPAAWLDRSLLDLPLARIAEVRVSGGADKPFSLSNRDDRFRLDDAPSAAMHDSQLGDALAGVLDRLQIEDVAVDDGASEVERELQFVAVDGLRVRVQVWHLGGRLWCRVTASVEEKVAAAWASQATGHAYALEDLPKLAASWNERFRARAFMLPADAATSLMLTHDEILAGVPGT